MGGANACPFTRGQIKCRAAPGGSEATQKAEQVGQVVRRRVWSHLVMEPGEDLFERGGAVIVQEAVALAHAAQRRRVEGAVATLVGEAHVVGPVRGERQGRDVAADAAALL